MAIFALNKELIFPPAHLAESDGLLAMGGDLSPERLILAYRNGIFPWYEGDTILWWYPDPRFVLFPEDLKINKSVRPLLKRNEFEFTVNKAFAEVIHNCKNINRAGQAGTWITDEMETAYKQLHQMGMAHSAEVWKNGKLAGGLYGVRIGKIYFGESMFSHVNNASRYAFIKYIEILKEEGICLIDCQLYTDYLASFGAKMIPGKEFGMQLKKLIG